MVRMPRVRARPHNRTMNPLVSRLVWIHFHIGSAWSADQWRRHAVTGQRQHKGWHGFLGVNSRNVCDTCLHPAQCEVWCCLNRTHWALGNVLATPIVPCCRVPWDRPGRAAAHAAPMRLPITTSCQEHRPRQIWVHDHLMCGLGPLSARWLARFHHNATETAYIKRLYASFLEPGGTARFVKDRASPERISSPLKQRSRLRFAHVEAKACQARPANSAV